MKTVLAVSRSVSPKLHLAQQGPRTDFSLSQTKRPKTRHNINLERVQLTFKCAFTCSRHGGPHLVQHQVFQRHRTSGVMKRNGLQCNPGRERNKTVHAGQKGRSLCRQAAPRAASPDGTTETAPSRAARNRLPADDVFFMTHELGVEPKTAAAALSVTVQNNCSWKMWNLINTTMDSEGTVTNMDVVLNEYRLKHVEFSSSPPWIQCYLGTWVHKFQECTKLSSQPSNCFPKLSRSGFVHFIPHLCRADSHRDVFHQHYRISATANIQTFEFPTIF